MGGIRGKASGHALAGMGGDQLALVKDFHQPLRGPDFDHGLEQAMGHAVEMAKLRFDFQMPRDNRDGRAPVSITRVRRVGRAGDARQVGQVRGTIPVGIFPDGPFAGH